MDVFAEGNDTIFTNLVTGESVTRKRCRDATVHHDDYGNSVVVAEVAGEDTEYEAQVLVFDKIFEQHLFEDIEGNLFIKDRAATSREERMLKKMFSKARMVFHSIHMFAGGPGGENPQPQDIAFKDNPGISAGGSGGAAAPHPGEPQENVYNFVFITPCEGSLALP